MHGARYTSRDLESTFRLILSVHITYMVTNWQIDVFDIRFLIFFKFRSPGTSDIFLITFYQKLLPSNFLLRKRDTKVFAKKKVTEKVHKGAYGPPLYFQALKYFLYKIHMQNYRNPCMANGKTTHLRGP